MIRNIITYDYDNDIYDCFMLSVGVMLYPWINTVVWPMGTMQQQTPYI